MDKVPNAVLFSLVQGAEYAESDIEHLLRREPNNNFRWNKFLRLQRHCFGELLGSSSVIETLRDPIKQPLNPEEIAELGSREAYLARILIQTRKDIALVLEKEGIAMISPYNARHLAPYTLPEPHPTFEQSMPLEVPLTREADKFLYEEGKP